MSTEQKTKSLDLQVFEARCGDCGKTSVSVHFLGASPDGYNLSGRVLCQNCGTAVEAVTTSVPIEFKELICPQCQKRQLTAIPSTVFEESPGQYAFVLTYVCKNKVCKFRRVITSILGGLWRSVKKIEASLEKISISFK